MNNPLYFIDQGGKYITDVNGKPIYTVARNEDRYENTEDQKFPTGPRLQRGSHGSAFATPLLIPLCASQLIPHPKKQFVTGKNTPSGHPQFAVGCTYGMHSSRFPTGIKYIIATQQFYAPAPPGRNIIAVGIAHRKLNYSGYSPNFAI